MTTEAPIRYELVVKRGVCELCDRVGELFNGACVECRQDVDRLNEK